MSDLILSYVRTYVPVAVGSAVAWVAVHWGIVVPEDLEAQAAIVLTGAVVLAYYTLVRALEKRWPAFGKLLGSAKKPVYVEPRR